MSVGSEFLDGAETQLLISPDGSIPFDGPDGHQTVKFDPVLRSANESLLRVAALEGMGLAFLPKWLVCQDLTDKRLELVLSELPPTRAQLFSVYPSRKYLSAKVRTFVDFVVHDQRLR
jgi:DNA-binding transcriptional LysR family regulator